MFNSTDNIKHEEDIIPSDIQGAPPVEIFVAGVKSLLNDLMQQRRKARYIANLNNLQSIVVYTV